MDARALIAAVRDSRPLPDDTLSLFVQSLSDGCVSDAQVGAFAMAVLLRGLDPSARRTLTTAMRDSGETLTWNTGRPVVDKHSTGGIGDCVSLVLAPALAACGATVPMISGRGLGHTGGTLDKLEAIPGVVTDLSTDRVKAIATEVGLVIAAASPSIAPADKRLYAIRDVSATVESLDLITASILSKKLAAGLENLVLDVKLGSGAFMKGMDQAHALATALVETANDAGCKTSALITDMNQPLAPAAGNALEVACAMRVLTNDVEDRLFELTCRIGGECLTLAGLADNATSGAALIAKSVQSGQAAEHFGRMLAAMGGPIRFAEDWERFLPETSVIREFLAPSDGFVSRIDTEVLGHAVVTLGGGRYVETDKIDPAVGLSDILPIGTAVKRGQPLLRVHANRFEKADQAEALLRTAIELSPNTPDPQSLIYQRIGA